jgi:hypothetical protein
MEESVNAPEEQTDDSVESPAKTKDHVSYDSHQKLLKEKKLEATKRKELEDAVKRLSQEKLEAEGNKDKVLEALKKELGEMKETFSKKEKFYAWNTVSGKIIQEALKQGCKNPDKLIRLLDDSDLSSIEVGEDFSVDTDALSLLVEKGKKENPFLFDSTNKIAAAGTPSRTPVKAKEKSEEEIFEAYIKKLK